jgi:hypothetical protein
MTIIHKWGRSHSKKHTRALTEVPKNGFEECFQTNNVLVDEQFGFRPNSSTEKATNRLLDQILTAFNVGHNVGGIFCDLKKAFDFSNHKILLSNLEFYDISGQMHKLIASYLRTMVPKVCTSAPLGATTSSQTRPKYYAIFIILFPFSIQCHRTRHLAELVKTTYLLFGEASVNGRFRRSYHLNTVIKASEVLKYFSRMPFINGSIFTKQQ